MGLFNKNTVKKTILVEGMKCMHCAAKVENTLKNHKVKADIDLSAKSVVVSYNKEKISLEEIKKVIEEIGFKCI